MAAISLFVLPLFSMCQWCPEFTNANATLGWGRRDEGINMPAKEGHRAPSILFIVDVILASITSEY